MTIIFSFCCPACGGDSGSRDEPEECRDCRAKRLASILAEFIDPDGWVGKR